MARSASQKHAKRALSPKKGYEVYTNRIVGTLCIGILIKGKLNYEYLVGRACDPVQPRNYIKVTLVSQPRAKSAVWKVCKRIVDHPQSKPLLAVCLHNQELRRVRALRPDCEM